MMLAEERQLCDPTTARIRRPWCEQVVVAEGRVIHSVVECLPAPKKKGVSCEGRPHLRRIGYVMHRCDGKRLTTE
jgi:hypothetical protein